MSELQVGKRLIHKEHLGLANDCSPHGDSLTLTSGKSLGLAIQIIDQIKNFSGLYDALMDFILGNAGNFKRKSHILFNGHMRIQSVILENHRNIAIFRLNVGNIDVTDVNMSFIYFFKTGKHSQRRRFSASGRSYENKKLAVLNLHAEVIHGRSIITGIDSTHMIKNYLCHFFNPFIGRYVPNDPSGRLLTTNTSVRGNPVS